MARYLWLADSAVTVEFGDEVSPELHRQVRAFSAAVLADSPTGLLEVVPTYRSATVHVDSQLCAAGEVEEALRRAEERADTSRLPPGKLHRLPVQYGGEHGPDLEDVARLHGLTPEQAVRLHGEPEYLVYCVGFSPGFAFLGGLPAELHTPRLGTPRKLVPAGSVALGGQQTGVYPISTPGGWRLLGRTNFTFFDVNADPPCPISSGDRIRFDAVDQLPAGENTRMLAAAKPWGQPCLEVVKPGLFTTVQDLGRWGYQSAGVSVSGAMDPLALRASNHLVGNDAAAAALEISLAGPTLRALHACTVGLAGAMIETRLNGQRVPAGEAMDLREGDELELGRASAGVRAYLAIEGGIDVPLVLGSHSTYTRAGFGGLDGRALEAGDKLTAGGAKPAARSAETADPPLPDGDELTVRVVLGPQHDAFDADVVDEFLSTAFHISTDADRMGYRLAGHPLRHRGPGEVVSDGIALGSVQVPPHGNPIVMLADRPSVGGYPKIATVVKADVRLVAQCRPGMRLRFRQVTLDEAWNSGATGVPKRLPVAELRELLAAMERTGSSHAALETTDFRLRLQRGSLD